MNNPTKLCPECKINKELELFCNNKGSLDGLNRICKECANKRARKIYPSRKDKAKQENRTYHESFYGQFGFIQRGARNRGIEFLLTREQCIPLYNAECYYCGDPTKGIAIDRIDSNGAYELANVVACCKICNYMKWTQTQEEFINRIVKMHRRLVL